MKKIKDWGELLPCDICRESKPTVDPTNLLCKNGCTQMSLGLRRKPQYDAKAANWQRLQRVRATLNEHLSEAEKSENNQAEEAFKFSIMLVDRELAKLEKEANG